jgi:hypothetical protein
VFWAVAKAPLRLKVRRTDKYAYEQKQCLQSRVVPPDAGNAAVAIIGFLLVCGLGSFQPAHFNTPSQPATVVLSC